MEVDALSMRAAYSQQDLGDRLGINRTTMVKLIDRFEAAGQVTRTRNPDDRRSYVLALTEGGRAAVKAMGPAVSAADDKLTACLTAAERDRLDALLADSGMQAKHFGALTVLADAACSQQQLARRPAALLTARRVVEDAEEEMSTTLGADGRAELVALLTALLRADV